MNRITSGLENRSVVAFESRMADSTVSLLERYGAKALSAPAMQEVPLESHGEVFDFAEHLFDPEREKIDVIIYTTGVGTKMLVETLEEQYERSEIVKALSDIITVARGPKPTKVLRTLNIPIEISVPEPNTSAQILESLDSYDETADLAGKRVAVQEYGGPNEVLNQGIIDRKGELLQVPIYRWSLPDDTELLERGIHSVIDGEVDVAVFTSKTQIEHALKAARNLGVESEFREALNRIYIASIGPVCSRGLDEADIHVDFIPSRPKLGIFIKELAEQDVAK